MHYLFVSFFAFFLVGGYKYEQPNTYLVVKGVTYMLYEQSYINKVNKDRPDAIIVKHRYLVSQKPLVRRKFEWKRYRYSRKV